MTETENEYFDKTYNWLINVFTCQQRWLDIETLWTAYPFKLKGFTKKEFIKVVEATKETK